MHGFSVLTTIKLQKYTNQPTDLQFSINKFKQLLKIKRHGQIQDPNKKSDGRIWH